MIGRLSSVDAAGHTWCSARASSPPGTCTGSPSGTVSFGYSSAGATRREKSERPAVIRACSSSTSTVTAPVSRRRDDVGEQLGVAEAP